MRTKKVSSRSIRRPQHLYRALPAVDSHLVNGVQTHRGIATAHHDGDTKLARNDGGV